VRCRLRPKDEQATYGINVVDLHVLSDALAQRDQPRAEVAETNAACAHENTVIYNLKEYAGVPQWNN
jgi:hypothetical protein